MPTGIGTFIKSLFAGYIRHYGNNRIFLNEPYTENKTKRQKYDLVFPRNAGGTMGLVLCIHSGAWVAGNKDSYVGSLFQLSEEKGVAAACINYRYVSAEVGFDDVMDDISAALTAIKRKGAKYGIGCDVELSDLDRAREALKKYSPVNFVNESTVPTVFGHGEQDVLVPYRNSLDLNAKLDDFHVKHTFISFPNSGHGCEDKPSMHMLMQLFFEYIDTYLIKNRSEATYEKA